MAIAEAPALAVRRAPVAVPARETLRRRITRHWADYLYVLPALLVMLVVIGYPLVRVSAGLHRVVVVSRHAAAHRRVGIQWHAELPGHPEWSALLANHDEHDLLDRWIDVVRLHT